MGTDSTRLQGHASTWSWRATVKSTAWNSGSKVVYGVGVEDLRAQIRPEIARYGTNVLAEHDRAVAALQQGVGRRGAYLEQALFGAGARVNVWPVGGGIWGEQMALTNWLGSVEQGKAIVGQRSADSFVRADQRPDEHADKAVRAPALHVWCVRLQPDEKPAVAMWEARVLLPKGRYRFSASVDCDQRIFRGPDCPVSIKLWGGQDQQFESNRTDAQHTDLSQSFVIDSDQSEEILIQIQATSSEMNLEFRFSSLVLARIP